MPTLDRSVYTSRPAELVWSFLSDFTTTEQWDPLTRQARRVEGDGGLGTVYRNRSEVFGREVQVTYTVVEHEAPHRLQLRGDAGRVRILDTIEVQPLGREVRVHRTVEYRLRGLARVATPLAGRSLGKVADDAARQLGIVLDAL